MLERKQLYQDMKRKLGMKDIPVGTWCIGGNRSRLERSLTILKTPRKENLKSRDTGSGDRNWNEKAGPDTRLPVVGGRVCDWHIPYLKQRSRGRPRSSKLAYFICISTLECWIHLNLLSEVRLHLTVLVFEWVTTCEQA